MSTSSLLGVDCMRTTFGRLGGADKDVNGRWGGVCNGTRGCRDEESFFAAGEDDDASLWTPGIDC